MTINYVQEKCLTCKFAGERQQFNEHPCQRHSPIAEKVESHVDTRVWPARFPIVRSDDYCGDWEGIPSSDGNRDSVKGEPVAYLWEDSRYAKGEVCGHFIGEAYESTLANNDIRLVPLYLHPATTENEQIRPALLDVEAERQRQIAKWEGIYDDDKYNALDWHEMIADYNGWARRMACMGSLDKARNRYIQVAALAVAAVEALDRNAAKGIK